MTHMMIKTSIYHVHYVSNLCSISKLQQNTWKRRFTPLIGSCSIGAIRFSDSTIPPHLANFTSFPSLRHDPKSLKHQVAYLCIIWLFDASMVQGKMHYGKFHFTRLIEFLGRFKL